MCILTIAATSATLRWVADESAKTYATTLGILVGIAASIVLSGVTLSSILDRMDAQQIRGAREYYSSHK
jgi:hypothetical protein